MLWQQTVVWCSPCCIELPTVCTCLSVLVLPSHPQFLLHIALLWPSKYVLNEYQTVRVNCFKNCVVQHSIYNAFSDSSIVS